MADVAIVGGGMCGLAAAFALRRLGIARIRHLDRREAGFEGPWLTYAGCGRCARPSTSPGRFWASPISASAPGGRPAWCRRLGGLGRIPRPMWMDYLRWYRRVTGAEVENGSRSKAYAGSGRAPPEPAPSRDGERCSMPAMWCWPPGVRVRRGQGCRARCCRSLASWCAIPPRRSTLRPSRGGGLR